MRDGFAPFEHTTRVQAVRDFVDWLYEDGPDPERVTRERLLHAYWERVAAEAIQSAVNEIVQQNEDRRAIDRAEAGRLVTFPGERSNPA